MSEALRVLQVEDSESDAALIVRLLEKAGYRVRAERVEDAGGMRAALARETWDVIVADYRVPGFDAPAALKVLHETGQDIPFLVVSGAMGEEVAVAMMKSGAHDYLIKQNLARLAPAVEREIREAHIRRERRRAEEALKIALKETEEGRRLLDAVFTAQTDGVLICDAGGTIIRTNPAGTAFFGFDPTGMRLEEVVERLHIKGGLDASTTRRALRGETTVNAEQAAGERTIETSSAPMRDAAGHIVGAVTISRDVTERKLAEERLRQTHKLESIGLLAGGIAHDFNNILTAVSGNISLALADLCPECSVRPVLDIALESVERAAGLTRQLLTYAGKGAFIRIPVSASATAAEAIRLLQASVPKKVELRAELSPGLPPLLMDPSQLEQILINLILNGVEAIGDKRSGVVVVSTSHRNGFVCIGVSDTGSGMDAETQQRMFEPFFTTKFLGRGLGLAAVDGIVRSLNGRISVESAAGQGTRIQILLPVASVREVSPEPAATATDRRAASGCVLIVDDEPQVRKMAAAFLKKSGIGVLEASNGQEAIDLLAASGRELRVVLLDMAMPGLAGDEALPTMVKLRPDLQVIVSSGLGDVEVSERFRSMSVRSFLWKPYDGEQLLAHVLPALECEASPGLKQG